MNREANAIQIIRPEEGLLRETGASIYNLANAIWPPEPGVTPKPLDQILSEWKEQKSTHFVITSDNDLRSEVLAHALLFRRDIATLRGMISVGALATVCVHPDYRGRNWGMAVVQAAFDYLPELGVPVSLFQTGVQAFYEKRGARLVSNRFVNGSDAKNPFWDQCEMIYPAAFDWPDGEIDLNGPGY